MSHVHNANVILPPYPPSVPKPPNTGDIPDPPAPQPVRARTKRLAIVALVTGLLGLAVCAIGVAVMTGDEEGTTAAPVAEDGRASALRADDCFRGFRQQGAKIFAQAVPCTSPHEGEVKGKPVLPILDYPGDARLASEGEKACKVQSSSLYAAGRDGEFTLLVDRPDEKAWKSGEHAVTCLLRYTGGSKDFRLEGQSTSLGYLEAGDCVGTWHDTGEVDVVECTKKHEVQVLARMMLDGDREPDEEKVFALCAQRARKLFGAKAPADLVLRLGGPNKREWASGQHYALCLAANEKGALTRSVIPG